MLEAYRRPAAAVLRAATRRETLPAHAREFASLAVTAAVWPFGWADRGVNEIRRRIQAGTGVVDTPVLLIHGYGANKSNWFFLERQLRAAGFGNIHALNYNPLRADVPTIAARCTRRAEALMEHSGSDRVHLIGHSLGGIVARWAVQLGGLDAAATCITIASPHKGSPLARLSRYGMAGQLRPGSPLLRDLSRSSRPTDTQFVAFYSNLDALVPGRMAMITEPELRATNILLKDEGHVSIMLSRRLADSVTAQLAAVEGLPGWGRPVAGIPVAGFPVAGALAPAIEPADEAGQHPEAATG
jgi:pimeloyl-ACP methyl ester carboxylesterase